MKFFLPLLAIVALAATWADAAFPPMPESVANGGEALRALWTSASQGTFMNVLPTHMASIQDEWTQFLSHEGEDIINQYYREAFRDRPNAATYQGHGKFVNMANFALTKPYRFHPNTNLYKAEVSALLIETFANRRAAANRAQWAQHLHLGGPGSS